MLKNLKLENTEMISVSEIRNGEHISSCGCYYDDLAPMTIIRADLRPAERSFIRVEIALPETWNGRLVGIGNGGAAGGLHSDRIHAAAKEGFAAVTTDLGTSPDPYKAGIGNPEVWKDFGYRATHLMTVVAKQIIREKYGKDPLYSYFIGGSTGGQQALSLAQRYPEDYDGIYAEVPAHCRAPLHAYFLWNYQNTHRKDGTLLFSKEQEERYIQSTLAYFASRETFPHAKGVFVSDPRWDDADKKAVRELTAQNDPTLTPEHLNALKRLQDGPVNSRTEERIFNGMPPATRFKPGCENLFLLRWIFGENTDLMAIDWDRDIDRYLNTLGPELNAENSDLDAFRKRGGKLLMYSGTADSCVPYHATLDYYERVVERYGSLESVRSFFRFYLLPGREHDDGPGIQILKNGFEVLRIWRETGIVPDLSGVRYGYQGYKVPLYPYPGKTGANGEFEEGTRGGVERIADRYLCLGKL